MFHYLPADYRLLNCLITTLFKNDQNSVFYRNSANTPTKDQENEFDDFEHNSNDETSENENVSTSTEDVISDSPKDSFSVLTERLDTLQNFFLNEISDIKAEIKNNCNQKTSTDISAANNENAEFVQN